MEVPQNGCFIMGIPTKMDDLGVPIFQETTIWGFPARHREYPKLAKDGFCMFLCPGKNVKQELDDKEGYPHDLGNLH